MKYVLGVIGVIVLLFVIAMLVFNRGDDPAQPTPLRSSQLVEFADKNSTVSVTSIGKVVGNEQHYSIRIVVTPVERRLEILNTYDDNVVRSQTFPNTSSAYETFLSALGGQGFLNSKETSIRDQRSACPTGTRYVYDLRENGESRVNLWSTSCNANGTFAGRAATVRELFERQIPDYDRLVTDVRL
jgi:hypothetical protein